MPLLKKLLETVQFLMAAGWEAKLKNIISSYGRKINDSTALTNEIRSMTSQISSAPTSAGGHAGRCRSWAKVPNSHPQRNANTEMQAL